MADEDRIEGARAGLGEILAAATASINGKSKAVTTGPEVYKPQERTRSVQEHGEAVAIAMMDMADRHFEIAKKYEEQAHKAREQAAAAAERHQLEIERYQKIADILDPPPPVTEH